MYVLLIVVPLIALGLFIQKVVMKSRLERGLGRQVKEHELTSLSAWMDAKPDDQSER